MEYKKLEEIIEFNPAETLKKGTLNKKISMDKLGAFSKYINSFEVEKYTGGMKFRNGDTLLARITPCLENGKTSKVTILDENEVGFGSTEYIVMRCKKDISDEDFIFYLAISPEFRNIAIKSMTGTSGRQRVQLDVVKNTEMLVPSYHEQIKIGKILSSIDKKIKLNNQINDNLFEVLKQYITEHYYNNNDIQNSTINKIGKIQGGYAFKSKDLLDEVTNNKVVKIRNISLSGVDVDNIQCVYDEVADKVDKKFLLARGDVIIAMTGAELGKTGYLFGKANRYFLNQRVGVVRGNDIFSSLYLNCVFLLDKMKNTLSSKGYGSAQPNISTSDIENIEIPIPDETKLKKFYEIANPIYNKMILNSEQNQYLAELRDTLLPKLMNGKINLDKIEI